MKVSDLAKEFDTTNQAILDKLKSLKLKAKGGNQELNKVVAEVLRSSLKKEGKSLPKAVKKPPLKVAGKEEKAEVKKEPKAKATRTSKKKTPVAAKKAGLGKDKKEAKPAVKKKAVKAKPAVTEKAAAVSGKPVKAKPKVAPAPFVPLKPLGKRKKRVATKTKEGPADVARESVVTEGAESGQPEAAAVEMPMSRPGGEPVTGGTSRPAAAGDTLGLPILELKVPIPVKDFAVAIQEKTSVVLKKLMEMGVFANINQNLGEDVVRELAGAFKFNLVKLKTQEQQLIEGHQSEEENPDLLEARAPVVTLMGHVDHGKTSLLDRIRRSRIADGEHGGITQHIGAYLVKLPKGQITFLDTPGHEAFTAMRARGAHITDIVVLVVAADEGVMPQTEEAIDHARAANVPIVVALNKIDRQNADADRVKKELADRGLMSEDWGGKTIVVGVSALTGAGVDEMLEMILLEAEMLELKANKTKRASGIVVEAHLSRGKGAVASLIVQSGTLQLNDVLVVGPYYGKVKAMFDDLERPIKTAGPSTPIEILGLPGVPEAGEMFYVVEDEKRGREIANLRQEQIKNERLRSSRKITLEDLYARIKEGQIKELNVILKADVQGSLEALKDSLSKIPSDEVKVKFIHTGIGDINVSDVILAAASNAIIIGFHVGLGPKADEELEKQQVDVRLYRIIYDAVNDVRKALEGMLEPKKRRKFLSRIDVRQVFKLSRSGIIAGCYVTKGKVTRKAKVDVIRDGEVVYSGAIASLKRFKDDVREVSEGFECGISLDKFEGILAGDVIEAYEVETIARTL